MTESSDPCFRATSVFKNWTKANTVIMLIATVGKSAGDIPNSSPGLDWRGMIKNMKTSPAMKRTAELIVSFFMPFILMGSRLSAHGLVYINDQFLRVSSLTGFTIGGPDVVGTTLPVRRRDWKVPPIMLAFR